MKFFLGWLLIFVLLILGLVVAEGWPELVIFGLAVIALFQHVRHWREQSTDNREP